MYMNIDLKVISILLIVLASFLLQDGKCNNLVVFHVMKMIYVNFVFYLCLIIRYAYIDLK